MVEAEDRAQRSLRRCCDRDIVARCRCRDQLDPHQGLARHRPPRERRRWGTGLKWPVLEPLILQLGHPARRANSEFALKCQRDALTSWVGGGVGSDFMWSNSVTREVMAVLAGVMLAAFVVERLPGQANACYCVLSVYWNAQEFRWDMAECTTSCPPGEGVCRNRRIVWADGTEEYSCACWSGNDYKWPACTCVGRVVNPDFETGQATPGVDCFTLTACPTASHKCDSAHLLGFPTAPAPICYCQ